MDHHSSDSIKVVVPKRSDQVAENQMASTDLGTPDLQLTPMNVLAMIVVRCGRVYFQSFLGMLTAAGMGAVAVVGADAHGANIPPDTALEAFRAAAYLSVFPVGYTAIQNAVELFTRLDERFPKMRA